MPYEPRIPASSNCVQFQSTQLYGAGSVAPPASSAVSSKPSGSAASSPSRTGSAVPSATGSAASANGASNTLASFNALTVGAVFVSALFGALAVL
ncbi:hypothetical protein FS749_000635 [Ceratobasidium sp. UAMH 11750]|nr:hypothetical protein FS749_000635 [Ceratobasidium sp. UAMH 11750]